MSTAQLTLPRIRERISPDLRMRLAPTIIAAIFAIPYVVISPPSLDLAAHLFRAALFNMEGFGIWNNLWYSGHDIVGYSVLFPAISAAITPQLAGAIAAVSSAALFERYARRHFGTDAWLGALLFGAATATNLYTGRLAFAFGVLPALGAIVAVDARRNAPACVLALISSLCSPVAGLFAALVAAGYALDRLLSDRGLTAALPGAAVIAAAVVPIGLIAIAFPEGGNEPFGIATLLPIALLTAIALATAPMQATTLRAALAIYLIATVGSYVVVSPLGSNIVRLATFVGTPVAVLFWRRRPVLMAVIGLPLLYLAWQAPIRDLSGAASDQSTATSYYTPLNRFLARQTGPPFRTEIPFTRFHWEAYVVATRFPLARGWERQLDIADNSIFYGGKLNAATYERWLDDNAVRFVAAPNTELDYSAIGEMRLIDSGLPYLHLVMRSRNWRVYAVANPTPIVDGAATLLELGPDSMTIRATRAGSALVHVRFTPYWALSGIHGCVAPAGDYTRVTVDGPGTFKLVTKLALGRIGATSPRCS